MRNRQPIFVLVGILLFTGTTAHGFFEEPIQTQPNIIFMMSDDQSWDGLSVPMHPKIQNSKSSIIQTPNIERLASEGMRFSAAYSPASVCSPTRMSLMTGKSPAANAWTKAGPSLSVRANPKLLPPRNIKSIRRDETTIAERLQSAGYATAHFGKWHLSGGGPGQHGFDQHDGDLGNEHAAKFSDPNPVDIFGMCERATNFMSTCKEKSQPFFLQLSWHALHSPNNASRKNVTKYKTKISNPRQIGRMALATDLDEGVGRIMETVSSLGLFDSTYVIYTSDNGGGGGSGRGKALSGGKGSLWEGGIRVPFIIRGPNIQSNSWCHESIVGYDLYPTFCQIAGLDPSGGSTQHALEGGSILPLLNNAGSGSVKRPREFLVFHFPHYQSEDGPHAAIIEANLKLIYFFETGKSKLFDLAKDLSEANDLTSKDPAKTDQLKAKLNEYLLSINAQFPKSNPNYDPNRPTQFSNGRGPQRQGQRRRRKSP